MWLSDGDVDVDTNNCWNVCWYWWTIWFTTLPMFPTYSPEIFSKIKLGSDY